MKKSFAVDFDTDDRVVGGLYLSLLKDLLEKDGLVLKGYSGEIKELEDSKTRVSPKQLYQVMSASLKSAPIDIGFRYGMTLNLVAAETVGQLLMSCANLNQVIKALERFHVLLAVSLDFELTLSDGMAVIQFKPFYGSELPTHIQCFLTEVLFAAIQNQARWLTGEQIQFNKLLIPYEQPHHYQLYEEFFECDIEFNATNHQLEFDLAYLNLPILTANEQLKQIKLQHCSEALKHWESRFSVENRVKAILSQSYPDFPELQQVASQLNTSRSCLYRKLQENQTSYQCLIKQFKQEESMKLLKQTSLTVHEIAEQLGFSDASSFRRAFKSWTGLQPSVVRESSVEQETIK